MFINMGKVRFGLVGTGRITDWVLKGAVLEPRFEAAAICSRSEDRAADFAARQIGRASCRERVCLYV